MEAVVFAALGICVGVLMVTVLSKKNKVDGKVKPKYDERQELVRGKAFKLGFFVLLFYNFIYGVLDAVLDNMILTPLLSAVLGACISIGAYAAYGIWKDAYYTLNEKRKTMILLVGVAFFCNLLAGIGNLRTGHMIKEGMLEISSACFMTAGLALFILIVTVLKQLKDQKEA